MVGKSGSGQSSEERLDALLNPNNDPDVGEALKVWRSGSLEQKWLEISEMREALEVKKLFDTITEEPSSKVSPADAETIKDTAAFVKMKSNDVAVEVDQLKERRNESIAESTVNNEELPLEAKAVVQEIKQSTKDLNELMKAVGTATVEVIGIGLLGTPGLGKDFQSMCAGIKRSAADLADRAPEWKEQAAAWAKEGFWEAADAVVDVLIAAVKCMRFVTSIFEWCSEKIHSAGKNRDEKPPEDRAQTTLDKGVEGAKDAVQGAAKVGESVFKAAGSLLTGVVKSLEALSDKLQDKVEQSQSARRGAAERP